MAPRTLLSQKEQIRSTESFNDTLPAGSTLEQQTSLQGDLNALRSQLKRMSGDGNWYSDISGRDLSTLSQDLTAAEGEISTLEGSLQQESATRASADTALQANIDAEAAARTTADAGLQSNIDAEAAARVSGDAAVQASVDAEVQRATSAENALDGRLTTAEGDISTLESDLAAEVSNRTSADAALQVNIDSEASARAAADETLQDNIDAEASIRESADLQIQASLTAEAGARAAADTTLQSNIDAEASARAAADVALQGNIDSEESAREAADLALENSVLAEASAREAADLTLQGNIDAEATARIAGDQQVLSALATETSNREAADTVLQGNIDLEASARAAEDAAINTALAAETAARESADIILDGRVTTAESDINALEGSVVALGNDKVAKSGDSMTDTLSIDAPTTALALSSLGGDVLTVSSSVDGQFLAVDASQYQMTFTDPLGSGDVAVLDPSEVVVSTNDANNVNLARTNITSGVIELVQAGSAAIPTAPEHAATKAYVDSVAQGLVVKAPVEAKYDFQGGSQPSVPSLPSEPASPVFEGTQYTVATEAEFDSALTSAVDGDLIFVPANTTVTLTSSKTINKSIKIHGQGSSSVFSTSFAVPANSGLFIVSGKKADNQTQNNNVMFANLAITSSSNANDHACIVANTLSTAFPNGSTGLRFENLTLNHTEFGITVAADSWVIKGCTFNYIPVTGAADTLRHLGIYNISSMGWVENCSFPATTEATPKTIAMLLTAADYDFTPGATRSGGYAGDFVVKNCSQLSGNLRQWLVMEVFKANGLNSAPMAEHGFNFWAIDNTHGVTSGGSFILADGTFGAVAGTKAPLDFFNIIYTSNNSCGESTGTDKGMIAVDGGGNLRSAGAPTALYVNVANSGSVFTAPLSGTYVQGSTVDNLLAIRSDVFSSPNSNALVTVEAPTAGGPLVPSGEQVNVGGYVAMAGDRIFVVDASNAVNSGVYICDIGDWLRAADFADGEDVASSFFFVKKGDYADTSWVETADPAVVGTDELEFAQFSGVGTYTGSGAISVSAQNVISVVSDGISTAMIADGAVTNDKLAGSIALSKLAEPVYNESEVDSALALKLDLAGGTMSGAIDMGGFGVTNLVGPSADQDAATKKYVDDAVSGALVRSAKVYADVTAAVPAGNTAYFSANGGNLSVELPEMPADSSAFELNVDIYVNGQLMRPGANYDVVRAVNLSRGLVFAFDLTVADVVCVVVSS